ncbi:MAG: hypothetical protein IIA33_08530, partial [Planctomycetes bacterium]|nr:hypothetical protein [Planctomycetota bacterium]
MLRKTLTILSLIGLLLSVGLWGVSYFQWGIIVNRYSLWAFNGALVMGRSQRDIMREDLEAVSDYHGTSFLHLGGRCYSFSS